MRDERPAGALPRISVVIPTWNRAHVLGEAVDSVLSQDPAPAEVIVVDDGSTDGTAAVLAGYGDRIRAIRRPNGGASAARNSGIAAATGDWVAFLDSDDIWLPGRMAVLARDLPGLAPEVGVHLADMRFTGEGYRAELFALRGRSLPADRVTAPADGLALALAGVSCLSMAVRRDWLARAGGFDERLRIYEDAALFTRLALMGPWALTGAVVAEGRRVTGDMAALSGLERHRKLESRSARAADLAGLAARGDLTPAQRRLLGRHASAALFRLAEAQRAEGRPGWRGTLWQAARLHPEPAKGWIRSAIAAALGRRGFARLLPRPEISRS